MDLFFDALVANKSKGIRSVVMDMWKPFRTSTQNQAPQAAVLLDKFHVTRHLGEVPDKVRRSEYARLKGGTALKTLLSAKKWRATAYPLKESFRHLWNYQRQAYARRFFDNWRAALKWQRLKPVEKFTEMIERHWHGITVRCAPENKGSLGFVKALNNKIRVIQRQA